MARYIVRPRSFKATAGVSLASTTLTPQARTAQIAEVGRLRSENPILNQLASALREAKNIRMVSQSEQTVPSTGTVVLDMDEEAAEELQREVEDLLVIKDRPLELIQPRRAVAASASLRPGDLWHLDAIGLLEVRRRNFSGTGAGVTVVVLDTGVDASHDEFSGKAIEMVTYDVDNWDTHSSAPSTDTDGHGTHVAGLVAGRTVGVAPSASIVNGVMIPNGNGNLSDFVLALEWCATRPDISIVNMSAGIRGFVEGMEEAIEDLLAFGVLPVIATGNEGRSRTRSPGNYNSVLSVGACNRHDAIATFSSSGTYSVNHQVYNVPDLVAPGEDVTSCVQGGGYEAWDGTSMATPIVSGVAALILERHPTIPVLDLMEALLDTCQDLNITVERQGAGIVQVIAATVGDLNDLSGTSAVASRPVRKKAKKATAKTKKRRAKKNGAKKKKGSAKKRPAKKKPAARKNSAKRKKTKAKAAKKRSTKKKPAKKRKKTTNKRITKRNKSKAKKTPAKKSRKATRK